MCVWLGSILLAVYQCKDITRSIRPRRVHDRSGTCSTATDSERGLTGWSREACDLARPDFAQACPVGLPATPLLQPTTHRGDHPFGERPHFATCALVGSGGSLLGSRCGEHIDQHEYVLRANAPVLTPLYALDVGVKTSLMAINAMLSRGIVAEPPWTAVHDDTDPNPRALDFTGMDIVSIAADPKRYEQLGQRQAAIQSAVGAERIFAASLPFLNVVVRSISPCTPRLTRLAPPAQPVVGVRGGEWGGWVARGWGSRVRFSKAIALSSDASVVFTAGQVARSSAQGRCGRGRAL